MTVALDPDLLRRDLLNCKVMGMNMIRSFTGLASRYQIELCDEIGLMVYQENYASWFMEPSPKMAERFDRSTLAMVKRDRNHPSIVMWGLLNETPKRPGRASGRRRAAAGPRARRHPHGACSTAAAGTARGKTFANPGVAKWQTDLADQHPYQPLPHNAARDPHPADHQRRPEALLALGIRHRQRRRPGAARAPLRTVGKTACEDAVIYRRFLDQFMADWQRWNLGDTFANPEDYFRQCVAWMAGLRKLGTNAIRANPHVIGHSLTGTQDQGLTGEGLTANIFRELKPGTIDAMFDAFAPLRWCLFVEPVQVYRGRKAQARSRAGQRRRARAGRLSGPAPSGRPARRDRLRPHDHGQDSRSEGQAGAAFALPVFAEDVVIDGPSGKYRFLATFQKGAAAAGGDVEFYVADPAEMPKVETEVVLWGDDPELANG